jgi:plasmid maintenance system antidote protein VapI
LTLPEQLRAIIQGRGISAGELAALAEVDRRQVARFVAGERDLTLATAGRIAAALGLRLAEAPGARRKAAAR